MYFMLLMMHYPPQIRQFNLSIYQTKVIANNNNNKNSKKKKNKTCNQVI